ncbi:CHAT domain-containing protein [Suillus variegatus]|nr:CHAT domain-containing protein [Suillus variegatus]
MTSSTHLILNGYLNLSSIRMSRFIPGHFSDCPPHLEEGPSHPEHPQDTGQKNLVLSEMLQVFVFNSAPDSPGDTIQALGEKSGQLEQPQDLGDTNLVISEVLQVATSNSLSDQLHDTLPALGKESSHPEHTQDPGQIHFSGVQQVVITSIRATNITLGLRRIPAGFHAVVKADGAEYQTSNQSVHVDQAVVEWHKRILLPRDPSSEVQVRVFASFELGPMVCHGELLRTFEISIRELLDRSERSHPIMFQPKQEDIVSACTSLFMTVEQRLSDQNDGGVLYSVSTLTSRDRDGTQNSMDLDQSISHFERASDLCPVNHPYCPAALLNLATAKFISCQANGRYLDLDIPISLFQEALDLRPIDHPDRPMTQLHLAISLLSRFARWGFQTDADTAEELLSDVLDVCHANSHICRAALIAIETSTVHGSMEANDLQQEGPATSMLLLSPNQLADQVEWCLQRDEPHDLDKMISLHYDALVYYNTGHAYRGQLLCNLAVMLVTHFKRRGNDKDLDQAIALQTEELALCQVGDPGRSMSLNNLANQLSSRFEEALALRPVGHTDRSSSLNNLATQLSSHFDHRGSDENLDQGIALHREALALCPVGHTNRSVSLNNLATQLSSRFEHQGNDEDLDQGIALHREALALRPVGNDEDFDQAIALHREALALCPVGYPDRSSSLDNLANLLSSRFDHRGNRENLDESLENLRCALTLLTQHDPRQLLVHKKLARIYLSFHHSGLDGTGAGKDAEYLNVAMHHFKAAANVVSRGLLSCLRTSLLWVRCADEHRHHTQLEAYTTSMQLLDAYMSKTASVSSRHNIMKEFPSTLAIDAALCALCSGDVCRAVELLEQGRTIIWTQMTQLCTPLDSLQTCGDHAVTLMNRFRDLTSLLNNPPANYLEGNPRVDVEAEETRYRRLVEDWNRAVEEIRMIEGFSCFLLPPLFSELQDAARDGPIVLLIASWLSCHAIVIPYKEPPTSIQLPTDLLKLTKLVLALQQAVEKDADSNGKQTALTKALRELWDVVICSRIWWCPTSLFNFLPLHAAGEYRAKGKSVSQQYISSYTPSLTALVKARASHVDSPSIPFVAIGQDCPAGASFTLNAVEPELELVQRLLPPPPTVSFSKITSVDATKSRALHALQDNTWLHLACHGTQNIVEFFKSAFLMRDKPLSLLDITQTDLSRHKFAFLSACQTAVSTISTPDEVIHLAAGLQFAGVNSVVGTMWKVTDSTVQHLVEAFYKNMHGDGPMNSKRAAWALHQAVLSLAHDKDILMTLDQRIVFVNIGI